MSSEQGASAAKIAALDSFRDSDLFSVEEVAALALAEAMSRTPADVPDTMFGELREYFSEPELVELVATIAMENFRARFNRAFDVEAQGLCLLRGITPPSAAAPDVGGARP